MRSLVVVLLAVLAGSLPAVPAAPPGSETRPRIRELGAAPGVLPPGPLDAITDVAGVRVGHQTLIRGDSVRTGVTAILPHGGNLFQKKPPAAVYVGNGFGKAAGFLQVRELGNLETPIVLTNTLSVGTAVAAVVAWTLEQPGNQGVQSVNAVVGETNDGFLNDIRGLQVTAADVRAAITSARPGPVAEGSVGAGTGTMALGWKGGIGTASRALPPSLGGFTVGALVQSNFGGVLAIDGVPVGKALGRYAFRDELADPGAGSCMIVLATDAPLSSRNLERLARRAVLGLARTGSFLSNGSGDFVIAFSTRNLVPHGPKQRSLTVDELTNDAMSPLFLAAVEAVEEAVYNSLLKATTVTGYQPGPYRRRNPGRPRARAADRGGTGEACAAVRRSHLTEGRDNDIVVLVLPPFDQAGNLPAGVHWVSWQEFSERFGMTPHRKRLLVGLREALLALQQAGCSTAYILAGALSPAKRLQAISTAAGIPRGSPSTSSIRYSSIFPTSGPRRGQSTGARCSPPGARQGPPGKHFLSFFSRTGKGIQKGSSPSLFRGCRYDQKRA